MSGRDVMSLWQTGGHVIPIWPRSYTGPRWLRVFLSNNSFKKRYVIRLGIHGDSAVANQTGTGNDVILG